MSPHEMLALRHPHIVGFHKFYSEYHLFMALGAERFKVSLRIYEANDGRFFFEQSHYVRTPVRSDSHEPDTARHDQPHVALSRGVESIVTFYDDAVEQGHQPSAEWFVRNEHY